MNRGAGTGIMNAGCRTRSGREQLAEVSGGARFESVEFQPGA